MKKGIALVTGINLTPAEVKFSGPHSATIVRDRGSCYKMNAAAGAATVLSNNGWFVYATGYHQDALDLFSKEMLREPYYVQKADLLDKASVTGIVQQLTRIKKEAALDVHLVHYGGASDTRAKLPGNSVFGTPWQIPGEAIPDLVANNCTSLLNVLQAMREMFKEQVVSKLIFVTALTALRTKLEHALDAAQKGAGHALARSLALDLTKENIYVTEVMPGITDTGFYDNPHTFESIVRASAALGYDYTTLNFPVFSAEQVGEAVRFALETDAHVRELSLMPYGQYPHMGA